MSMIYRDECSDLGLPEPKIGEKQIHYVIRAMLNGHRLDTRMCRYIGIGNLHSLVSALTKLKLSFSLKHETVACPKTKKVLSHPVDVIWMTPEQIEDYWSKKKA
ncbi:hypothetical protein BIT28_26945 [Photobacterium proteolyticum]|uniref:Uncharacterized protein n=1 Tax=Photobacterium proteolyticum TaxID=1903952 RepID=A0A1Q9GSC8_9GAMM|nr:hypothetical protein [Photobacterium proteolyticum]OLQ77609.1 hypothetical protein BIT28_26945 [Photobacterium proteolyticum]